MKRKNKISNQKWWVESVIYTFGCKRVIVVVIIMSLLFLSACTEKYKQGKQQ
jgi:hypothetical protein